MKNYAVLEGMKHQTKDIVEIAFNKGYDQGYYDGKLDGEDEKIEKLEKQLDDEKKAEYDRGYADGKKEVAAELNFEKGYDKGYKDGTKARDSERGSIYHDGYGDGLKYGYKEGLKHGQELRAEEAKCAEACGMRRAWEAARKIVETEVCGGLSADDSEAIFGETSFQIVLEKFSPQEAITRLEAWEKKQEENEM